MDRRTFITRTFLVSGAVGAASVGYIGFRESSELAKPLRPLYVLDDIAFGVLVAFAETVLTVPDVSYRELAHTVDGSLRFLAPEAQSDLNLVLAVLENSLAGVFTRGSMTLFSELSPEGRGEAIRRWGTSPVAMLRGASNSLRKLVLGVHYAPLENSKEIGYPGPPFEVPEPEPIQPRGALAKPWTPTPAPGRDHAVETQTQEEP